MIDKQIINKDAVLYVERADIALQHIEDRSIQCCVTSPPYWGQRIYNGTDGCLGMEPTQKEYIDNLVFILDMVGKCLKNDGVLWLNLGDGHYTKTSTNRNGATNLGGNKVRGGGVYALPVRSDPHIKEKELCGTPWAVAFALRECGFYIRDSIIWQKPSPMPGGAADRCVSSYENVFMLTKSKRYKFNREAMSEDAVGGGKRWMRNVWRIPSARGNGWHFARMPGELAARCIFGTTDDGDTVLDPFSGSGTTGIVAVANGRKYVGIENDPAYASASIENWEE